MRGCIGRGRVPQAWLAEVGQSVVREIRGGGTPHPTQTPKASCFCCGSPLDPAIVSSVVLFHAEMANLKLRLQSDGDSSLFASFASSLLKVCGIPFVSSMFRVVWRGLDNK